MKYGRIIPYDTANGPGIRTSIFVSGCTNNCEGCFNKEAQDFTYGDAVTEDTVKKIISYLKNPYVEGLSILGGDPLCQDCEGLAILSGLVLSTSAIGKSTWLWTGFLWEDVFKKSLSSVNVAQQTLLELCSVVVDGLFIEKEKDLSLRWRGSANQRVIDVEKTLVSNKVVLVEGT